MEIYVTFIIGVAVGMFSCIITLYIARNKYTKEVTPSASHNSARAKSFLLQVDDIVNCRECRDKDKISGIRILVSEQLRP